MPEELEYLRSLLSSAEKAYTRGHEYAVKSQEHTDAMLTWAIGFMGAGLYTTYSLRGGAPGWARLLALTPWLLGVLCALAGRIVLARVLNYDALGAHARNSKILLLMLETNVQLVKQNWKELTENDALFDGEKKAKSLAPWTERLYGVTHLLFGLGLIGVAVAVAVYGTGKPT